jgi:S-formylglutathione hydrolase FrmB
MGKGCVRFKSLEDLALDVVGRTVARVSAEDHMANYQAARALMGKGKTSAKKGAKKSAVKKAKPKEVTLATAFNEHDPWFLHQYTNCDIRLVTGCGPWENSGPTYRMSEVLRNRGITHHLDDWCPEGGHDWPRWNHQMWEYVGVHF